MKSDRNLRLALLSLIVNIAYSLYNLYIGFANFSWWFITLAAYYIVLSTMRFGILLSSRKAGSSQSFIVKFTGGMFLALAITLAGATYLSFEFDIGIKHHEILMITVALYSFIKITLAIINLVKSRKVHSQVLRTLRNIAFADGLVSVFSLQRSMLVSFEGLSTWEIRLFNAITGTAVYVIIFILGLNLLGGKKINMAKSKLVKANEKIAETVVGGYKKIESTVVEGYTKIEDKFVDKYLTHDGETVEEAKKRLKGQDK